MQIQIVAQGMEILEADRDYVEQKINHLADFGDILKDEAVHSHINVSWQGDKAKAGHLALDVVIFVPGAIIRAEALATTLQEATDIAFEKLKRQIDKYTAKRHRRDKAGQWIPVSTLEQISGAEQEYEPEQEPVVLKRKKFASLPAMHEEEALHQLELLDHDFFVYKSIDTGLINIAYRRHKGGYGLMEISN